MSLPRVSARGWWAFGLASLGLLWTIALIPGAFYLPAYSGAASGADGTTTHTTATLVGVNGTWIVWLFVPPLALAVLAWLGLHLRCSSGSRVGASVGRAAAVLLVAFAILGFSAGFLVLPAALLITFAAVLTPAGQPSPRTV